MTATTTTNTAEAERFDINKFYRDYLAAHNGMFPDAIAYNGKEWHKRQQDIPGVPEYHTQRGDYLVGVRAIQLIGLQQATEVTL